MTAYHLIVVAKVAIFAVNQIFLMAHCVHAQAEEKAPALVYLMLYAITLAYFFTSVYPV